MTHMALTASRPTDNKIICLNAQAPAIGGKFKTRKTAHQAKLATKAQAGTCMHATWHPAFAAASLSITSLTDHVSGLPSSLPLLRSR